jgi:hypothetical protein
MGLAHINNIVLARSKKVPAVNDHALGREV